MRLASETIFSGKDVTIPMSDVAFIEKDPRTDPLFSGAIRVVMKASKWNDETQAYEPSAWMPKEEASRFMVSWCHYRSEIDPVVQGATNDSVLRGLEQARCGELKDLGSFAPEGSDGLVGDISNSADSGSPRVAGAVEPKVTA